MKDLEKQKLKLESSKERIRQREKMLKEKEKMSAQATITNLGQLFVRTKLSHLDNEILFGALLEIAEKSHDENALHHWRQKSQQHASATKNSHVTNGGSRVTISFKSQPNLTAEIKERLKEMKFKWNEFRGEYYGFGDRESLQNLLANHECSIETIESIE